MAHPPRILVCLKWDQPVIYFLTFCVANRQTVPANDIAFAAFKGAIVRLTKWNVIAAILMPDHVHLLIAPLEREAAVGNASAALKALYLSGSQGHMAMAAGQFRSIAPFR
jgi:REP element-mobilizing transposase RayT